MVILLQDKRKGLHVRFVSDLHAECDPILRPIPVQEQISEKAASFPKFGINGQNANIWPSDMHTNQIGNRTQNCTCIQSFISTQGGTVVLLMHEITRPALARPNLSFVVLLLPSKRNP